jgi:hypothetical protein
MLISCWSLKGGSGTTVVAVALASLLGRRHPGGALVVDLGGDVPAALGRPEPSVAGDGPGPGVADWLAAGAGVAPDGWSRLEVRVNAHLALVPRGAGPLPAGERAEVLAGLLAAGGRPVVVDCGVLGTTDGDGSSAPGAGHVLASSATASLLVTRACYLALRRCAALPLRPSGVVLMHEPARALRHRDVESAVGAPVVAVVPHDAAVARAVDSGALATIVPRSLARALRAAA